MRVAWDVLRILVGLVLMVTLVAEMADPREWWVLMLVALLVVGLIESMVHRRSWSPL